MRHDLEAYLAGQKIAPKSVAVPEPADLLLAVIGAAVLAVRRRRAA